MNPQNITEFRIQHFYDVDVREFVLGEIFDEVGELGLWICHTHTYAKNQLSSKRTVVWNLWIQPDPRPFSADSRPVLEVRSFSRSSIHKCRR